MAPPGHASSGRRGRRGHRGAAGAHACIEAPGATPASVDIGDRREAGCPTCRRGTSIALRRRARQRWKAAWFPAPLPLNAPPSDAYPARCVPGSSKLQLCSPHGRWWPCAAAWSSARVPECGIDSAAAPRGGTPARRAFAVLRRHASVGPVPRRATRAAGPPPRLITRRGGSPAEAPRSSTAPTRIVVRFRSARHAARTGQRLDAYREPR